MKMFNYISVFAIFAGTLTITSCSRDSNNQKNMEQFSADDFLNRPIYKELTEQNLDSTANDNLLQVVFDNLTEKFPIDYRKEHRTVMSWNKSRQAIYMIWLLESEVNNGGYNQFYANSSGQFSEYLPASLRLVGAVEFAALMEQANRIYEIENAKITEHQDGTLEGFSKSYDDNPLNDLDKAFFDLYKIENLHQLQVDYIRGHKLDFCDK